METKLQNRENQQIKFIEAPMNLNYISVKLTPLIIKKLISLAAGFLEISV